MKTLMIRAEDKNKYEKRVPITPEDLADIISETDVRVCVQKSGKRFYPDLVFEKIGAQLCDDMTSGDIILGIKEIPTEKILDNKTYVFFSHTIKGQKDNMPMLKRIITSKSTLIDYEKITEKNGRRLVFFGPYAGDAGAINILWLMGQYWRHNGIMTPFSNVEQAIQYHSVDEVKRHLIKVAQQIKHTGLPDTLSPVVFGILGYGNVSKGAQNILNVLPVKYIHPEDLPDLESTADSRHHIYACVFKEKDLVRKKDGSKFDLLEYYHSPEKYESNFDQYLPYITILINAVYWENKYPRFVTWDALKQLHEKGHTKLQGIADITCDVNGSIECNVKATDSGNPAYLCDPLTKTVTDGYEGKGILVLAVDNLPCELAHDSSSFFSSLFKRFVPNLLEADLSKPLKKSGLLPELQNAVIVQNGQLTERYKYLEKHIADI